MNAEIENYKAKIEFLEKKVFELEKLNKNLSASLQQQYQFSAKVANIIFDMDSLLAKKSDEIAHLKMQLLQSPADSTIEDFAIDLDKDSVESNYSPQPQITIGVSSARTTSVDVNEYVIRHEFKKLEIERNSVGVFECPNEAGCYYKTSTKYHNGEGYIRKKRPRRSQQHANTIKKRRLAYKLKIKTETQ